LNKRMGVVTLSLIGLLMSVYLVLWKAGMLGALVCGTGGCETVQLSKWGDLFGIPVAVYGVGGYLALMVVGMVGLQPPWENRAEPALFMFAASSIGVIFTLYLTYLEAFVIHAWCRWCLVSAAIITIIFVLSALDWWEKRRTD
jgi:uncharacterized membrane protein